jgi:hypothetical protein
VVDDVMTEDAAMASGKTRVGLGRIRREWSKTRKALGGD